MGAFVSVGRRAGEGQWVLEGGTMGRGDTGLRPNCWDGPGCQMLDFAKQRYAAESLLGMTMAFTPLSRPYALSCHCLGAAAAL